MSPEATVSAVLIVKDEGTVLATCLEALTWVDELIVYDTGSTDDTRAVAARYTDRVIDGFWDDDFAGARNRAIACATGDWILVVDADEVFSGSPSRVRRALAGAPSSATDRFLLPVFSCDAERAAAEGGSMSVRLFRRDRYRYAGRLHEQVVPCADDTGEMSTLGGCRLTHSGYTAEAKQRHDKPARNLALARRALQEAVAVGTTGVDLAIVRANLARSLASAEVYDEALTIGEELLAHGLLPRGTTTVLAQSMIVAATELGQVQDADRWLDVWAAADTLPVWAKAMRVRLLAAREDAPGVLEVLAGLPSETSDSTGRRFLKHSVAAAWVWALEATGAEHEAGQVVLDAARAGHVSVSPTRLEGILGASGRTIGEFVEAMHPGIWRTYAVWCADESSPASLRLLHAMHVHRPDDAAVLLCAAGLSSQLGLEDLALWAGPVRAAGFAELCPLVAAATDQRRDAGTRALAAGLAFSVFEDPRALAALEQALQQVSPADERALLTQLEVVAPGLVSVQS